MEGGEVVCVVSIDAIIDGVTSHSEGALLLLRDPPGRIAGQKALIVLNPPPAGFDAVMGMHIWGNSYSIMIGDREWAKRIGYSRIKLNQAKPQ